MRKKSLLRKCLPVFALYAIILFSPTGIRAQSANGKISFDLKSVPLTEIFKQIEQQVKQRIAYDESILPDLKIDLSARNDSVENVLDRALAGTNLTYRVKGNYIVITRESESTVFSATLSLNIICA